MRRQQTKCEQRQHILDEQESSQDSSERSCFDCTTNLSWLNRNDGIAHCGAFKSMGVPQNTHHHTHKHARISKEKQSNYYDLIELYKLVGEAICYRSLDRGDGAENKNSIVSMIFSTNIKGFHDHNENDKNIVAACTDNLTISIGI